MITGAPIFFFLVLVAATVENWMEVPTVGGSSPGGGQVVLELALLLSS